MNGHMTELKFGHTVVTPFVTITSLLAVARSLLTSHQVPVVLSLFFSMSTVS
jgi:hypothetical protein